MEMLRELKRMGKSIFISSHILSELAELCDAVTIIDRGEVKYSGAMDDLLDHEQSEHNFLITMVTPHDDVVPQLQAMPCVQEAEMVNGKGEVRIVLRAESNLNQMLQCIMDAGLTIRSINPDRKHLNQAFMDLTRGGVA